MVREIYAKDSAGEFYILPKTVNASELPMVIPGFKTGEMPRSTRSDEREDIAFYRAA
jgi:hypothetical protein